MSNVSFLGSYLFFHELSNSTPHTSSNDGFMIAKNLREHGGKTRSRHHLLTSGGGVVGWKL
jgi:hypothetical protein